MFESYCLLTVLDLAINVGLGLLISGVAGALAALGCEGRKKKKPSYLYFLENKLNID